MHYQMAQFFLPGFQYMHVNGEFVRVLKVVGLASKSIVGSFQVTLYQIGRVQW